MRDLNLFRTLRVSGHDISMIPMYLPVGGDDETVGGNSPIFYGAVNMYLMELFPWYHHAPQWLEKLLNSRSILRYAAKKAGSTRAAGLEDMTVSMLMGEDGHQASQLDQLISYLRDDVVPDVVHLSNALLLGLARRIKTELGVKVVCSLQDENEWVDPMSADYRGKVWGLMAEKAADVDIFVTPSRYYARKAGALLHIPPGKICVVHDGLDLEGYRRSPLPTDPPVIGYLCRMSEYFGLGILIDAFLLLKQNPRFRNARLHLTGGYTGDDKKFVGEMLEMIAARGFGDDVRIFEDFGRENKVRFLESLTLLSVPVPGGEAFGAYQVEALATGVPIVQPNVGGYPEFIEATGGGVLYEPNDPEILANALASLLGDPEKLRVLGERGRKAVAEKYSMDTMAKNIVEIYEGVMGSESA